MEIGIILNKSARGLSKDAALLTPIIESLGHTVELLQYDEPCEKSFALLIFLEITPRHLVRLSESAPWLIVNPEFLKPENVKTVERSFSKVLCKTREAHRICAELFKDKAHYVGFLSQDRFEPSICREKTILHIAGQSNAKNTTAIIDAFRWKRNGESLKAKLIVVSDFEMDDLPEGVTVLHHLSDEVLRNLQNVCQIHLQPSATEGWSHVLHEAMSVNASILTTDAAPMNEIHAAYKIPSTGSVLFNSVKMHEVSAIDVHCAIQDMLRLGRNGFAATGMPRKEFLDGNEAFKKAFASHLEMTATGVKLQTEATIRHSENPCIAFIGNFAAEHSTENQILWALEQGLGYEVEKLQENKVSLQDIRSACEYSQILMWVRTPGWLQIPDDKMFELLDWCKKRGVKTCSVHLDKFFGIPEREALIGKIPFWRTAYCFTADGSRQEDFKARGVNHFWMKPAVSEVYCHPGTPRDEYRCDVGFVGARFYHAEYPFRRDMVGFLEQTYGSRFKHIEGVRGHLLNDVYASMKVVVGDCFQAGTPYYWSDRVPETCGRHGFLLHPTVEGLDIPVLQYEAQNLESLREYVDAAVQMPADVRRENAFNNALHVREGDTWTIRCREILETVAK